MNINCFTRPNKPLVCTSPDFNINVPIIDIETPKLLTVDKGTECHITPDHIADLMVSYLNYEKATIDRASSSVLEPHGGTGQLINAMIKSGILSACIATVEKHYKLVEYMQDRFNENFVSISQGDFLSSEYDLYIGEYDRVICNPPFKQIKKHIDRVYDCLRVGGQAVCLVPITYNKLDHEVLEILPNDTFNYCTVNTKIIRITNHD